ncbi:alpha/beta fold hydrolase [Streptomyces sp. NPDC057616]|uniref:alpha/beta fold hydrolase n=1 Tax=Streptomyces sp. NPDC057616 TaxID=3346183 RepID=UPI00369B338C
MTRADTTAVVLLHALPLNSSMWDTQARALRSRGHTVVAPDQRGFGTTPLGTSPPSLDVVADDLAGQLDERGIDRAVLAGCSMGGYVAMAFLRRHRDRVRALALLSTRARADTPQEAAGRRAFAALMLDDQARDQVVERTTPALLGATTRARRPGTATRVTAMATAAAPASVAWAQHAIAARPDSLDVLRAADLPTVVINGEEDELVSVEDARATAQALPRGRLISVPASGHIPPLEAPDAITEALVALLDETSRQERTAAVRSEAVRNTPERNGAAAW